MEQAHTPVITVEQLYHDHRQPILRYLNRLVRDPEMAEDLCQETFIKALRYWNELQQIAVARSWLYRIATNTAYDELRRRRRVAWSSLAEEQEALVSGSMLERQLEESEPIQAALQHLPGQYRVPLVLQLCAGYSLNDIATALGCNVNTVKTRVHRARRRFRELYVA